MSAKELPEDLPITVDRNIMSGTRVPVQTVFDYLADGYTLDEFVDKFPSVHRTDAIAVLDAGDILEL